MRKSHKVLIYKYLSGFAAGGLMAWMYLSSRLNDQLLPAERYCVLCDAFSLPGLLLLSVAILMSINNAGGLDTLAYLMSFLPRIIAPGAFGEPEKLLDFVEKRRQKRKKGYGFLYVVGLVYLGIALYFLVQFYKYL